MAVAIGDIIRVNANMLMQNTEIYTNVFHFQITANATADDDAFMDDMAGYIDLTYAEVDDIMTDELDFTNISAQNITQDEILPTKTWPFRTSGLDAGDPLPFQVAALVYYPTIRPKTRASSYLPGLTEASNTAAGVWIAATVTALEDWGDLFLGLVGSVDITMRRGAYNLALNRFTPVNSRVVPTRARTQRRRRPGVGV
jgi:hypothetical protein